MELIVKRNFKHNGTNNLIAGKVKKSWEINNKIDEDLCEQSSEDI